MEIKLVIDGEEVVLRPIGKSQKGTYEKYAAPPPYDGPVGSPLIVSVYVKPGWKPSGQQSPKK